MTRRPRWLIPLVVLLFLAVGAVAAVVITLGSAGGSTTPPSTTTGAHRRPDARVGAAGLASAVARPDPTRTPGAADPAVTQSSLRQTICTSGYSAAVRPDRQITDAIKRRQLFAAGLRGAGSHYELDHLIPLSLGGSSDEGNLWLEPREGTGMPAAAGTGAETKDALELALHRSVCAGHTRLADAQRAIATDWYAAWAAAGRPRPAGLSTGR